MSVEFLHTEKELFLRIAEGDERAFRALFDQYRERLFTFAWQLCHSATEAEEVVQDIFLRLWENRAKLDQVDFPRKYLYVMARNRTFDLLKKIAKDRELVREVWVHIYQADNETQNLLQAAESQQLILEAVALLPERKQVIFRLSRHEGLSHQAIAQQMGLSVQTVKNLLTEILKHIRLHLSAHSPLLATLFWLQTFSLLF